jgi:selenocysteine lyase/cysteine desulfurase
MTDWQKIRGYFPIAREWVYLNHAAMGPTPIQVVEKMAELYRARLARDVTEEHNLDCNESVREKVAQLIGARPEEIAFCGNTSEGVIRAADAVPLEAGDNIVIPDQEFPANAYPWLALRTRGVEVRFVSAANDWYHLENFERALDSRTRVVAVSWVSFVNGFRVDLPGLSALCQDRGVRLFVDAMQGAGALRLDLERTAVDFLAFHSVKWLCGPFGVGVFYCSRKAMRSLAPTLLGWRSVQRQGLEDLLDFSLPVFESARRFEWGSPNATAIAGFGAALDLFLEIGPAAIEERILGLSGLLSTALVDRGLELTSCLKTGHRSGITTFRLPQAEEFVLAARAQRIAVSLRKGTVRVSIHFFNNEDDLARLLEFLDSWRR